MTREQFKHLIDPLVVALRGDFDLPTWTVYFRALEDVPVPLLASAVERAAKSAIFMPKPGELRQFAEEARRALLQAHPFEPCAMCSQQGWMETEINGERRMVRCQCWAVHQRKLAELGATRDPVALALPPTSQDAWTPIGDAQ